MKKHGQVQTPIGIVKQSFSLVPDGWRILDISQGRMYKQYLNKLLDEWDIVFFKAGHLTGPGYGNGFGESTDGEWRFIVSMPTLDITAVFFLTNIFDHWEENLLEQVIMQFLPQIQDEK